MSNQKYTPTPWTISLVKQYPNAFFIWDKAGNYLENVDDREEIAAFIVRACNAHDELVAALEYITAPNHHPAVALENAKKALAKARGEA